MTAAEHARQVERVKLSLLLGIRPAPRPPRADHDVREAAFIRCVGGSWRA